MLKKTHSAVTTSVIACPLACHAWKRCLEEFPVNRVEDEGQHDRTPLFEPRRRVGRLCFRAASSAAKNGFVDPGYIRTGKGEGMRCCSHVAYRGPSGDQNFSARCDGSLQFDVQLPFQVTCRAAGRFNTRFDWRLSSFAKSAR
jgi:hypothetical protein